MRFRILIEQDEDGVYIAECPSLPGCISQGETRQEAVENIREAMQGYLASLKNMMSRSPRPSRKRSSRSLSDEQTSRCFRAGWMFAGHCKNGGTFSIIKPEAISS
jgi:predicted RNase H-like HicB family nuclease